MASRYAPVHYHDYLQLDKLLSAQQPKSREYGHESHDETLFIIVHQAYELWFKQLLHELDSIVAILQKNQVAEKEMGLVVHRLHRMGEIFRLLIDQINVLETMTPLDFLDFREVLFPASGFQSFQFRRLEARLGLPEPQRLRYNAQPYTAALKGEQAGELDAIERGANLFSCVEKWLERTPFLNVAGFDFWQTYRSAVQAMFARDREVVIGNSSLGPTDRERNLKIIDTAEAAFSTLFDPKKFAAAKQAGSWRLSLTSLHAALFIQVYRDQPVLQQPFKLLTAIIDLDELLTNWRYRHALMAKRMLGTKIGTGGSSGFDYLKASTEQHRIFQDFNQLTTFFIPRSSLPQLPPEMEKELGFYYSAVGAKFKS
jgi:tryptophan 2,3-dioxygenase